MVITSRSNERVKAIRALERKKERAASGLHRIEGEKTIREAIDSGAVLSDVFIEDGYVSTLSFADAAVYTVSRDVLCCLSDCETPQGIVATVKTPALTPPERYPAGLIAVLDCVQDPGNVGTILRTADAMGAVGILFSSDSADPFSPKVLRSAMGSTYHIPVWQGELGCELAKLTAQGFTCLCGHLHGSEELPPVTNAMALVIGNEGNGVPEAHAALCYRYRLPMFGRAESLNASVAAGILLYEIAIKMKGI